MTKLYRSRHGLLLGVCDGIAQWRDLPVETVRMLFTIITICTGFAPCLIVYLVLAMVLPVRPEYEYEGGAYYGRYNHYRGSEEDDRRRREADWDSRFYKR